MKINKNILIKTYFSGWHKVGEDITLEQAKNILIHYINNMIAIKKEKRKNFINKNFIKGATVEELLKI